MSIGALQAGGSGLAASLWMASVAAGGIATATTVRSGGDEPHRASRVQLAERPGAGGVSVVGTAPGTAEPTVARDPGNPLADDRGYVTLPAVEVPAEMTLTLMAQRSAQANIVTVQAASEAYRDAVQLLSPGRGDAGRVQAVTV